jgi:hypothetical protein
VSEHDKPLPARDHLTPCSPHPLAALAERLLRAALRERDEERRPVRKSSHPLLS